MACVYIFYNCKTRSDRARWYATMCRCPDNRQKGAHDSHCVVVWCCNVNWVTSPSRVPCVSPPTAVNYWTISTRNTTKGYYESDQNRFVSGNGASDDVDVFEPFLDENASSSYRLTWPYSNPNYTMAWERFVNKSYVTTTNITEGNARCDPLVSLSPPNIFAHIFFFSKLSLMGHVVMKNGCFSNSPPAPCLAI